LDDDERPSVDAEVDGLLALLSGIDQTMPAAPPPVVPAPPPASALSAATDGAAMAPGEPVALAAASVTAGGGAADAPLPLGPDGETLPTTPDETAATDPAAAATDPDGLAPATTPAATDAAAVEPVLTPPTFVLPADLLLELVPPATAGAAGDDAPAAPAPELTLPAARLEQPVAPVPDAPPPSPPAARDARPPVAASGDEPAAAPARAEAAAPDRAEAAAPDRAEPMATREARPATREPAAPPAVETPLVPLPDGMSLREARLPGEAMAMTAKPAEPGAATAEARLTVDQIPLRIAHAVARDEHRITIRLDPPDLGRIDVTLDTRDDLVRVAMAVERPETLDLLRRDSQALDQALARANLRLDGGLDLSLRQDAQRFGGQPGGSGDGRQPWANGFGRAEAAEDGPAPAALRQHRSGDGSIDIIV
jgi:hypothetical protein